MLKLNPSPRRQRIFASIRKTILLSFVMLAGRLCSAGDADIKMTTTNGSTKFTLQNSNSVEVASVTSLGDAFFNNIRIQPGVASMPVQTDASKNFTTGAIDLSGAQVTGNMGTTHLNSGTGATSSTFWRGDGSWASPATAGNVLTTNTDQTVSGVKTFTSSVTVSNAVLMGIAGSAVTISSNVVMPGTTHYQNGNMILGVSGSVINMPPLTASLPVQTDASKNLTSAAINLSGVQVTGNLGVNNLNSGTAATAATFWRGDGSWASPATGSNVMTTNTDQTVAGVKTFTSSVTVSNAVLMGIAGSAVTISSNVVIPGTTFYHNGNVVMGVSGGAVNLPPLTASLPVQTDASKNLTSAAINLSGAQVTGNLGVNNLNSGTGATGVTFWRGDGSWASPATGSNVMTTNTDQTVSGVKTFTSSVTVGNAVLMGIAGSAVTISSNVVMPGTTIYQNGNVVLGAAASVVKVPSLSVSLPVQTDASDNLVSAAIDLSGAQATGALAAARFPALTGDVTTSAGSLATALSAASISGPKTFGSSMTVNNAVWMGSAGQAVTISSNIVTPGATFYQNGTVVFGDPTLNAFAAFNTNGILTQTTANTFTGRTVTAGTNKVRITNGDGVSGNPTVDLNQTYAVSNSPSQTTTANTLTDVTNLGFAIGASETWSFEFNLQIGCNNTGGVRFAINGPAGATLRASEVGMTTAVTAQTSDVMTTLNTAGIAFNTVNLATGWLRITGSVVNSTNAGTIQLRFQSGTNTQTSSIFYPSYMVARRH